MLVSEIIDYCKLATRATNTELSSTELLQLTSLAINKVYTDLELLIDNHVIDVNTDNFSYTLPDNYLTVEQIMVRLEDGNIEYIHLNDMRDSKVYAKIDSNVTSPKVISFYIEEYDKVDTVTIFYSISIIPNGVSDSDEIPLALLEPITLYINYLSYTLLGLKDLQVAMFHKQEYVECMDILKSNSKLIHSERYLKVKEVNIHDKGYV